MGALGEAPFVAGLVLAAGGSRRLGQPKQLLAYGEGTLLGHVLDVAWACPFDQSLCVLGGGAAGVREQVDLEGFDVVVNERFGEGCSSSIAAAVAAIDRRAEVLVLMLGDQPGVSATTVAALLAGRGEAPMAVCEYGDGRGHPLAFARSTFAALSDLHGDKGVWRLMDRLGDEVRPVPVAGPSPLDVDTWEDYETVLAAAAGS